MEAAVVLKLTDEQLQVGLTAPVGAGENLNLPTVGIQISPGEQPVTTGIFHPEGGHKLIGDS